MKKLCLLIMLCSLNINALAAQKKVINTDEAPSPIGTYSQAVKVDNYLYLSGQIGINPATGELVSKDFTEQVRQVFMNLEKVAKAGGFSLNDSVKLTVFLTDLQNFSKVNEVMPQFISSPYPARSAIEVKGLPKGAIIEIEAILAK